MVNLLCANSKLISINRKFLTRDGSDFYALPFTLDNYTNLFNPLYAQVVWNSLYMSGIATIICLLIGYPFAFMVSKINPKYRPFLLFLVVLPFWTNSLIRIYGMKVFLGVKGVLNTMLMDMGILIEPIRILNTEVAVIIGLVYLLLPFMILPLYSAIEKLDGRLLEAAKRFRRECGSTFLPCNFAINHARYRSGLFISITTCNGACSM